MLAIWFHCTRHTPDPEVRRAHKKLCPWWQTEKGHSQLLTARRGCRHACFSSVLACAARPRPTQAHQMSPHLELLCGQHLFSRHSGWTPLTPLFSKPDVSMISFCLCQFSLFWPKGWRKSITPLWGLEWPPGELGGKTSKGLRHTSSGRPCLSA